MTWLNLRIVAFSIAFVSGLAWIAYSFVKLGVDNSLPYLAVVVAACAAIASLMSFQWARDTVRPFVFFTGHIDVGGKDDNRYITFHIKNSGTIPASNVGVNVFPFGTAEKMTKNNKGKTYKFPKEEDVFVIIFPNLEFQAVKDFDITKPEDKHVWDNMIAGNVKLRIVISYKSLRRRHKTIQSIRLDQFDEQKSKLWGLIIEPQMWK